MPVLFPYCMPFSPNREIASHIPEPFWQIQVGYKDPPTSNANCTFEWLRGRLFDEFIAAVLYEVRPALALFVGEGLWKGKKGGM